MNKAYERINWENYPSENTALNEENLNKMDAALNEVDNRVVAHETTKLDVATANSMVRNVSFNERSGIFTITYLNGSTKELDTKLEKIATNFVYDEERQKLILTLIDGTTQEIDMSALITEYEFENSAYIKWTVVNGKVKAEIINGSITADKLQPNFLADVTLQANSAKTSEQNAKVSEENAKQSEINAKNYADSAEPVASTTQGLNPTLDNSTGAPIISFKGDGATEQNIEKYLTELTEVSSGVETNLIDCKSGDEIVVDCGVARMVDYHFYSDDGMGGFEQGTSNVQVHTFTALGKMQFTIRGGTLDDNIKITVNGSEYNNPSPTNEVPIYGVGESRNLCDVGNVTNEVSCTIPIDYLTNGEIYTLSCVLNSTDTDHTLCAVYKNNTVSGSTNLGSQARNTRLSIPFTKVENDNVVRIYASYDNSHSQGDTITATDIQIEKGTKATPYKPYGKHVLSAKSTGNNIFDLENAEWTKYDNSNTITAENNELTIKGVWYCYTKVKVQPNTDYFISADYTTDSTGENAGKIKINNSQNKTLLSAKYPNFTFNSGENSEIYLVFYTSHGTSGTTTWTNIQLEKGTEKTDFEPYVETKADIPLSSPLYEGDYIKYRMDGSGELARKNREYIVDRNSYTVKMGYENNYAMVYLPFKGVSSGAGTTPEENARCTHFVGAVRSQIYYGEVSEGIVISGDGSFVMVRIDGYSTLEEYNAWFDSANCKIVYKLAEPIVTELTAEQIAAFEKLRTFDGTTHITCEAESEIQYFCDSVGGKTVAMIANMLKK